MSGRLYGRAHGVTLAPLESQQEEGRRRISGPLQGSLSCRVRDRGKRSCNMLDRLLAFFLAGQDKCTYYCSIFQVHACTSTNVQRDKLQDRCSYSRPGQPAGAGTAAATVLLLGRYYYLDCTSCLDARFCLDRRWPFIFWRRLVAKLVWDMATTREYSQ